MTGEKNLRAYLEGLTTSLRQARRRLSDIEGKQREPIAIVGLGLRLPGGAVDPESLGSFLERGIDAVAPIPASRWDADAIYDPVTAQDIAAQEAIPEASMEEVCSKLAAAAQELTNAA